MMQARWTAGRTARALAATLVVAAAVTGLGAAGAAGAAAAPTAGCRSLTGAQPLNPDTSNQLSGVAVLSPCNVWAVGSYVSGGIGRTLVEHWNGFAWRVVPSPSVGTRSSGLLGVRAASPSDIWAVGAYNIASGTSKTLILHWNGHTWRQVPSPSPGAGPGTEVVLTAVRTVSGKDAWAVGSSFNGTVSTAFILHWNGHTWKRASNPAGARGNLSGVAATSARNAWAVGDSEAGSKQSATLIVHWNGRTWSRVASPSPGSGSFLTAVGASSARDAWAVGSYAGTSKTLILHWNGRVWTRVSSPNAGGSAIDNTLEGVAVISGADAWAVGFSSTSTTQKSLILHWNGHAWRRTAAPDPDGGSFLNAVAESSASNVWAVGRIGNGTASQALALHCC
jgi:hypothetical protein